jgi:hypothetical protein
MIGGIAKHILKAVYPHAASCEWLATHLQLRSIRSIT